MNPSSIDRALRPSKNWDPQIVNKELKKGEFDGLLSPRPFTNYREIYVRNPFFPLPPFQPPKKTTPVKHEKDTPKKESMDLVCTGVMSMTGKKLVAVLQNTKTGKTYFAEEGMVIEGYKVESITSSSVILTREGRPKYELKIGG